MPDTLRLGLVGAGAIAQSYIKALEGSSLGRWVGIADVRREAAEAAAELMGCDAYRSHEDLADRAACDRPICHRCEREGEACDLLHRPIVEIRCHAAAFSR